MNNLPPWDDIPEFYRELLVIGGLGRYEECRLKIIKALRVLSKLWREYRTLIKYSIDAPEARKQAREFIGRALSVVRRSRKCLDILAESVKIAKDSPCINTEEPVIVVAGMPQTGKSTFVGRVSTVKPVVAPYPFTTKNIILGHLVLGPFFKIQIMDTPGILDRPLEELNEIERKAIAAINYLASVVVFLMDVSKDSYYTLDRQIYVYNSVKNILRDEDRILVVINKVDKLTKDELRGAIEALRSAGIDNVMCISALKGFGVEEVISKALDILGIRLEEIFNEGRGVLRKALMSTRH